MLSYEITYEVTQVNENPEETLSRFRTGHYSLLGILLGASLLLVGVSATAFAGGATTSDPRTFGAYQIDVDTGPVGIQIQGHASTQVVRITEEDIPSDVAIHYDEQGGILHVTAGYVNSKKAKALPAKAKIYATMPRYEFVHIKTSSGPVTIDNLSTDHLSVQTKTGNIHVTNTNAALKAASTTGNQVYNQIYGALILTSTTGNMSFANTWGTMKLRSQAGSFSGSKVALAGNSSFRTSSGSIKIYLDYGLGRYTFDMRSTGGKLRLGQIARTHRIQWGNGNISVSSITGSGAQDFQ